MISLTAPTLRVVLYEGAGSQPLPDADRAAILRTLLEKGYSVSSPRGEGSLSAVFGACSAQTASRTGSNMGSATLPPVWPRPSVRRSPALS